MVRTFIGRFRGVIGGSLLALSVSAAPAQAATIWTDWTQASIGNPGAAVGTLPGVTVTYAGELDGAVTTGVSGIWSPNTSFTGGTVTASPSVVNDDLRLNGSFTGVSTISFSSPVVNPVFAVWSLGQPGLQAAFNFVGATPTFQAGGPNSQFGGSAITVSGNSVLGFEGNGVVQFVGTFSSLSFTNTPENFYAFTVGVNGRTVQAPEPMTLSLLGAGLVGLIARRRAKR